ncbi:Clavaminate synthase-like protein [Sparassis latifolia]
MLRRIFPRRLFSTAVSTDSLSFNGRILPFRWLRDSCQCPQCVHPSTRQKLHRTSDVPLDIHPTANGVKHTDDGLHIRWGSGHESHYAGEFLERYSSPQRLHTFHADVDPHPWDVKELRSATDLYLSYASIQTSSGLSTAITQLVRYGLLFVTGVPNAESSNEACELRKLAERFGEIRPTFYGETWDVKDVRNSRNIAYTNIDLGLHMDLLYFQHPPRYQILHCLRNRVSGGTSVFVDALHAALTLRACNPADFVTLASTPVAFHYINDGHHLHFEHPTIQLAPTPTPMSASTSTFSADLDPDVRAIQYINYSPPFQAPLPSSTPAPFYSALQRFVELLESPAARYEYTLREGDAVLFDNRRVLHARTAFQDHEALHGEDATSRWLKGCYLEADAVLDRGRVLRQQL